MKRKDFYQRTVSKVLKTLNTKIIIIKKLKKEIADENNLTICKNTQDDVEKIEKLSLINANARYELLSAN